MSRSSSPPQEFMFILGLPLSPFTLLSPSASTPPSLDVFRACLDKQVSAPALIWGMNHSSGNVHQCWPPQSAQLLLNTLMSDVYTPSYSLHVASQGCTLFWLFHIPCDRNCFLARPLAFSRLHLAGEIIHGYVWKGSCSSLIPPLVSQKHVSASGTDSSEPSTRTQQEYI